jgi:hypothetical protein
MFAWSQLDFSAIPVSISAAVSLTSRQTWQNVNSKRRLQRIQNVHKVKRHQKKKTSSCFCICSFCFWGEVSNSWIWNDIGRNFLLGNRKKIAKCLMRAFTCRSTFLYMVSAHGCAVHRVPLVSCIQYLDTPPIPTSMSWCTHRARCWSFGIICLSMKLLYLCIKRGDVLIYRPFFSVSIFYFLISSSPDIEITSIVFVCLERDENLLMPSQITVQQ